MNAIQFNLASKHNVNAAFLEFVGIQDERETIGKMIYHFNVMDPQHAKYKSTVVWIQ